MANVLDLRRRIRSVRNMRQITRAMKMVSAAKLRRAQERAMNGRPYAQMLVSVLESLRRRIEVFDPETGNLRHALFETREEKNVLLVIISGDKGFAGAFNSNIARAATRFLGGRGERTVDIEAVGRKSRDLVRRKYPAAERPQGGRHADAGTGAAGESGGHASERAADHAPDHAADRAGEPAPDAALPRADRHRQGPIEVTGDHPGRLEKVERERVGALAAEIIRRYIHKEIDAVYVVYNEFRSVIQQRVVVERLLPLLELGEHQIAAAEEMSREERERAGEAALAAGVPLRAEDTSQADEEAKKFGTQNVDYLYEQPPHELFDGLLRQYVFVMLYHAMLESVAAEHAARMTAMDSAANNASDIIDALTLTMNRVRQAAITKEIIEIVSGASALS
jgi:F-type H+-transporting ATPase subunit gamma